MNFEIRRVVYDPPKYPKDPDESMSEWRHRILSATPPSKLQYREYINNGHWSDWTDVEVVHFPTPI
jgi:hypothetical protein